MPSQLASVEYVLEVAKDWAVAAFAAAQDSDFSLTPQRFELDTLGVRRTALPDDSPEALSPLEALLDPPRPTAWIHPTQLTILSDIDEATIAHEQEVVEVLAMDDYEIVAEVAFVVRIPSVPPCLGRFSSSL
jgi:hypothetical protein